MADNKQVTLGQFRALTDELPDSAPLTINVNHGDDFLIDIRDVVEIDVAHMRGSPYAEIILDCAPPEVVTEVRSG